MSNENYPIAAITTAAQIIDESEREQVLAKITNNLPPKLRVCRDTLALIEWASGQTSYPDARLALTQYTDLIED